MYIYSESDLSQVISFPNKPSLPIIFGSFFFIVARMFLGSFLVVAKSVQIVCCAIIFSWYRFSLRKVIVPVSVV